MRFSEYLRTTVLLLSSTSIALLLIAILAIVRESSGVLLVFTIVWIVASVAIGLWIGRGGAAMESIRALLSRSRPEPVFPRIEPGAVLLTRLWPVLLIALAAAVASIWFPSLAIATSGYGLIWALSWRKQALAVEAIEERDAVHFWLVRGSVFSRPKLVRVPAM
ncbi:MAG: hypothetical protein HZB14_00935 [Actinobacteria bacterium]|nr:hypothetical protein [Actinomycetota bacterium]